ncbi:hypothetical protein CFIMG_004669RA [Ceratocystis fimbriata CBS 114723]|uniref:Uncharacterized protein n=1 Tax=Ceratocystis fimbriata CBS 114723 TaxID=1035309 RepID=A0A2C5WYL3_9PEZI|nr:hypothetical protein CFIMG_004669RA [Ceratocystis fimbriata CBS 114723]
MKAFYRNDYLPCARAAT